MMQFFTMRNGREVPYYGPLRRNGFGLSSPDDGQQLRDHVARETGHYANIPGESVTTINAILKLLGQPTLSVDANDENLPAKLRELQQQIEENLKIQGGMKTPAATMANRGGGRPAERLLSDLEVADRIAKRTGRPLKEVLETMPKFGI